MSLIRNLENDENGWFAEGIFTSKSLFKGEMKVSIFIDDGATEQDAEKCIVHYNDLINQKDIMNDIQEHLVKFFLYMYKEWRAMGDIYGEIAESLEPVMDAYNAGESLLAYLSKPTLNVYPQLENTIGYGIECECPWEPEHQCMILIRNDKLLYVGSADVNDPWGDDEDYYCIWNDENEE